MIPLLLSHTPYLANFFLVLILFHVFRCHVRIMIQWKGSLQRSLRCLCWLSQMPIELFQRNAASPWTITYRPFENNVHKICYAVLPLLAFLRLINPGPAGVALGVTFLLSSLMSQVRRRSESGFEITAWVASSSFDIEIWS